MHILLKTLEKSVVSLAVLMFTCVAFADSPRGGATTSAARGGASNNQNQGRGATNVQRMPSMPILPLNVIGNKLPSNGNEINTINEVPTTPEPINPNPGPNPGPNPNPNPNPTPNGLCDLSYTVDSCMADIAACVNSGALPNGINSMFDAELRESIFNGMNLCISQVEYCISNVKLPKSDNSGCVPMYQSTRDVWLDFNARRVQPAYYAFVLSRTGLTPIQAENTCLLLDRNTYGASFNAVGKLDNTNSEYAQAVAAYNSQKPKDKDAPLIKPNPQGAEVNTNGTYDANRGYYARWDAQNAQCLLRVAAYNKDKLITNDVFGIGDKGPAQVWRATGETFTCNKDLFGFSLMNDTKKAAIIAVPVGTAVGAGIGFAAGHKASDFNCNDESQRRTLTEAIRTRSNLSALRQFMKDHAVSDVSEALTEGNLVSTGKIINKEACEQLRTLYEIMGDAKEALESCEDTARNYGVTLDLNTERYLAGHCETYGEMVYEEQEKICKETYDKCTGEKKCNCEVYVTTTKEPFKIEIDSKVVANPDIKETLSAHCKFKELNQALQSSDSVYCDTKEGCIIKREFEAEIAKLRTAFAGLEDAFAGQKDNRAKTTAIGAASGAAAGGTATLITAFVEKNRINCRVGDDLDRVELNKSYTIDRLRDFYVKWALQVPKTPASSSALIVTNCGNWDAICKTFTSADECTNATVGYMPENIYTPREVVSACRMNGATCGINMTTAKRYGIVDNDATCPTSTPGTGGSGTQGATTR